MPIKETNVDADEKGMDKVKVNRTWTPPAGEEDTWKTTRVRILPPDQNFEGDEYYNWVATHGNLPGASRRIYCPNRMSHGEEQCQACNISAAFYRAGQNEKGAKVGASWQAIVNVLLLNRDGSLMKDSDGNTMIEKAIKTWCMPKNVKTVLDEKLLTFEDETKPRSKAERDIANPQTGYDILIRRKGKGVKDTRYEVKVVDESTKLPKAVLNYLNDHDLPDVTAVYPVVNGDRIIQLLEAPAMKALPAGRNSEDEGDDPWGEDKAVEGESRVLPDDDDEDEEPPAKKTTKAKSDDDAKTNAAREELMKQLAGGNDDDDED